MSQILDENCRIIISDDKPISIIDYPGTIKKLCNCKKEVAFTLIANHITIDLCEECLCEIGKLIIDALR
jgi:hypothetical protein